MNNLDSFLKEEQGVGLIDSTGQFTIAADKALEKLAHSQLPDPSYWILKVVQFATGYGVKKMDVKVGRRVTSVQMELPAPLSVIQLQQGLDSVDPLPSPFLDHLVTGLRALGGVDSRVFVLNLKSPDVSEFLLWDGEKLSARQEEQRSPRATLTLEVSSKGGSIWNMDWKSRQSRIGEIHALGSRAFIAPLELRVDGRLLTYDHLDQPGYFVQPLLWDFAPFEGGTDLPFFMKPEPTDTVLVSAFWNLSYNYSLKHKILRLSPEPKDEDRTSRVYWTKDGVIVKINELRPSWPFTINLFVDCRDCPADLGGLNLRETETFIAKRNWVEGLLVDISHRAKNSLLEMSELEGSTLGGWDTFVATMSHLPLSGTVKYDESGYIANTLNAHPGFRKKLLARIKHCARMRGETIIPDALIT
jgi:hypothetical protein